MRGRLKSETRPWDQPASLPASCCSSNRRWKTSNPSPLHQPRLHWIPLDVLHRFGKVIFIAAEAVVVFAEPEGTLAASLLIASGDRATSISFLL